ncbi:carbohydrate binding domain-containing protein [Bacillus suaedae]|uniref:Carbohydrate binding domain-containing protein n=1 Tax=Halalkalibacter suaedae TaxID=2822140 RepID=A0A940X0E1_9BACI|nr:carbohydrate binding domain-containing protein [Bacillus suaedae]MBP3952635.1 carbohydrate binding domain-containing protein [Bacillus suaedae]
MKKWIGTIILTCLIVGSLLMQNVSAKSGPQPNETIGQASIDEKEEVVELNLEKNGLESEVEELDESLTGDQINELLESAEKDLFGWSAVGADIERVEIESIHGNASVRITTENKQEHEGVVLALSPIKPEVNYEYSVYAKGEGDVYLEIEETSSRGQFLKRTQSESVTLTNEWQRIDLNIETVAETNQVDLFILTASQQRALFYTDMIQFNEL